MGKKFDTTIKSSSFRNGVLKMDGELALDMRGDPRIDRIIAEVEKTGLKLPEHEKEISEKVAEIMHRKEFYGPYNAKSDQLQEQLGDIRGKIQYIELNKNNETTLKREGKTTAQFEKELEALRKQEAEATKNVNGDLSNRNIKSLKDVKSGETVCFHQAAIMAHVMDRLGSENDLCAGVVESTYAPYQHAYVQSREGKKNIIDSTQEITYWYNTNNADIRDGEMVLACQTPHGAALSSSTTFGGGKHPGFIQSRFPDKFLREQIEQDEPKTPEQINQTILHANLHREQAKPLTISFPKDIDKQVLEILKTLDKGVFGRGIISPEELEKGKDKLTEQQKQILDKAGVSFGDNDSYKISEPNCGTNKNPDRNLGSPNRR